MADGHLVHKGAIAVDPDIIPLGSYVRINGRLFKAEDTGSAIKGYHLFDIWMYSCSDAINWGKKIVTWQLLKKSYSPLLKGINKQAFIQQLYWKIFNL